MEKNNSTRAIARKKQPKSPSILSHPVVPDKRRTLDKKIFCKGRKATKQKKLLPIFTRVPFRKDWPDLQDIL